MTVPKCDSLTKARLAPWFMPTSSAWITSRVAAEADDGTAGTGMRTRLDGASRQIGDETALAGTILAPIWEKVGGRWSGPTILAVRLHHFGADVDPVEVSEHLSRFGYAIVDDVADQGLLDRLEAEATRYIEASDAGRDTYDGRFTRRTGALVARCPASRSLVMHPLVVGAVSHFLGHASAVQLHLTQIISVEPGETAQKLHRDEMAFDFFDFGVGYQVQCNTMWALTDFTADNGATWILPGTSGLDDASAHTVAGAQAEMGRGSVLFYEGKVLHGAGANTSSGVRRGVNLTYAVGWVRQEENQYLACPPEIARTLDDDLLKMMGYTQGAFALGYVGDQTDPLAALRGGTAKAKTIGAVAEHNTDAGRFVADIADAGDC